MDPFVIRSGLHTPQREEAARRVEDQAKAAGLELIRCSFVDPHGLLRGKTFTVNELRSLLQGGCNAPSSLLGKDTSNRTVFPVFSPDLKAVPAFLRGAGDMMMVPDPDTFRVLPWAANTGWMLCDLYAPDGQPLAVSTRRLLQASVAKLARHGLALLTGVELEFHLFKLVDERLDLTDSGQPGRPPEVQLTSKGYRYLSEEQFDRLEPAMELFRKGLTQAGLPLRSLEIEFGPSQCELTLRPQEALAAADSVVLVRSAIRQIANRNGYHATFMCRPAIPNVISSGWHLHQSLTRDGDSALITDEPGRLVSEAGEQYLAGLMKHACDGALFAAPTINAYRRYRAMSMAPARATWSCVSRGAMVRLIGGGLDPATRFENRLGEPAANPYLYIASQIEAGLDGLDHKLPPPAPTDDVYSEERPPLPKSLREAVCRTRASEHFRAAFGADFVDYYCHIKDEELARFDAEVTPWEHAEYFDTF